MNQVKLVSITKPVADGVATAEDFLAYVARVSNPTNQNNTETAPKLIKYLMKNAHWSPFEMVHLTLEIKTTRDIGRQILRHRSFSFQEFSQRYAEVAEMAEPREARIQDKKNRQKSVEIEKYNDPTWSTPLTAEQILAVDWEIQQQKIIDFAAMIYKDAIKNGIAKEVARSVLPEGLTQSTMYMSGSLRSWIHYCDLRRANGTQKEHMEIANMCWEIITSSFPSVAKAKDEIAADKKNSEITAFQAKLLEMATKNEYGQYVVTIA